MMYVHPVVVEIFDSITDHAHFALPSLITDVHADAVGSLHSAIAFPTSLLELWLIPNIGTLRHSAETTFCLVASMFSFPMCQETPLTKETFAEHCTRRFHLNGHTKCNCTKTHTYMCHLP